MNTIVIEFIKKCTTWNIEDISCISKIGGLSSNNYKVTYNNVNYFVKICTHTYLHTNIENELDVLKKTCKINLCPELIYYSTKNGNMISQWIHGKSPDLNDLNSSDFLMSLSKNLLKLHSLECNNIFNPFKHIRKRLDKCNMLNIKLPTSIDLVLKKLNLLEESLMKNLHIGLCHNDLNASNIILCHDKLFFVDYEYSSMGDIFFDLASISWFLSECKRKELLELYFGEYKEEYYEKLIDYLFVVKFYNATWSLLKSTNTSSNYDYYKGAEMIFEELLNENSIRSIYY